MRLVDVILFAHIAVVIITFAVAAILLTAQRSCGRSTTVAEVRTWGRVAHRFEPAFPVLAVLLFGLGAWLVHLSGGRFQWSDGWVLTAVAALAVMELDGALLLAPRGRRLARLIALAEDGLLEERIRRAVCDPLAWAAAHLNSGLAAGVVLTMTTKPSAAVCVLIIGVAGVLAAGMGASAAHRSGTSPGGRTSSPRIGRAATVTATAEQR